MNLYMFYVEAMRTNTSTPDGVQEKIGDLAYRIKIPESWKIHPIISIAQLEPAPRDKDPYDREPKYPKPGPVVDWDDPDPRTR